MKRKTAFLAAALLLAGTMTGCGSGSGSGRRSSRTDSSSSAAREESSRRSGESSVSAETESSSGLPASSLTAKFYEKLRSAQSFVVFIREFDEREEMDNFAFDDGREMVFGTGGKVRFTRYDAGIERESYLYDGSAYYYLINGAPCYAKGAQIQELFGDTFAMNNNTAGTPENVREFMTKVFGLETETDWKSVVESGSISYEGTDCEYEDLYYNKLGENSFLWSDYRISDTSGILRMIYDRSGNLREVITMRNGRPTMRLGLMLKFDISGYSDLLRVPSTYQECAYFGGSLYRYFSEGISWESAEQACRRLGGHLASVNSPEEQNFVFSLTKNDRAENIWIGGYCDMDEWKWTDGSEFSYTNWDMHDDETGTEYWQPDNYSGAEYYLRYANKSIQYEYWYCNAGRWNDTENGGDSDAPLSSFGYICEW